jgi:rod shape-determining protein MreD
MFKKILISIIVFYFLVLIQTSFWVHFNILGIVPNLVLISVILWNLFEKSKNYFGLYAALIGGLFLDIFSNRFIGFYILISLALAVFLKLVFKRYVRIPFIEKS